VTRASFRSKSAPWRKGLFWPYALDLLAVFWACFWALTFLFQPRACWAKVGLLDSVLWRIGGRVMEVEAEGRRGRD
jgi:hypothetical protein